MRDPANIRAVELSGAHWMGFIFHKGSPRYAGETPLGYLPSCVRVGVFVNESIDNILSIVSAFGISAVQLHGSEDPSLCQQLKERGLLVIKAFGVGDGLPDNIADYHQVCDYFLFDTACKCHGGSGKMFDWSVLCDYHGSTPFLLSGGLSAASVEALRSFSHPFMAGIDVNSGFETAPALKDADALAVFFRQLSKN